MRLRVSDTPAFTLLELLTVMAIIIVLAAMILGGVGYAQRRAASERSTAELAALSTAIESYKIDNGDYPRTPPKKNENGEEEKQGTDLVIPVNVNTGDIGTAITDYPSSSGILLLAKLEGSNNSARYFEPKNDMLSTGADRYLIDPFGNPYGYSTAGTFNPTFDLWGTQGVTVHPIKDATEKKERPISLWWTHNW